MLKRRMFSDIQITSRQSFMVTNRQEQCGQAELSVSLKEPPCLMAWILKQNRRNGKGPNVGPALLDRITGGYVKSSKSHRGNRRRDKGLVFARSKCGSALVMKDADAGRICDWRGSQGWRSAKGGIGDLVRQVLDPAGHGPGDTAQ